MSERGRGVGQGDPLPCHHERRMKKSSKSWQLLLDGFSLIQFIKNQDLNFFSGAAGSQRDPRVTVPPGFFDGFIIKQGLYKIPGCIMQFSE